jgi:predicted CoA-binding protein
MSNMSITMGGVEIDLETLLSQTYRDLQANLNESEFQLRTLAMLEEQDGSFEDAVKHVDKIVENIDNMVLLFKDLKKVAGQIRGLPDNEEDKIWYNLHLQKKKQEILNKKINEKLMKE